jgi:hypothetical protein
MMLFCPNPACPYKINQKKLKTFVVFICFLVLCSSCITITYNDKAGKNQIYSIRKDKSGNILSYIESRYANFKYFHLFLSSSGIIENYYLTMGDKSSFSLSHVFDGKGGYVLGFLPVDDSELWLEFIQPDDRESVIVLLFDAHRVWDKETIKNCCKSRQAPDSDPLLSRYGITPSNGNRVITVQTIAGDLGYKVENNRLINRGYTNLPKVIDTEQSIIYVPSGIEPDKKYPLIVALSPVADAQSMINVWKDIAEKNKWIIFASKEFKKNWIPISSILTLLKAQLNDVLSDFPVDSSKVIVSGFSENGIGVHSFVFLYPELMSAIIINNGAMHEYYITQKDKYPKGKIAVFLANPTRLQYKEIQRDRDFLESLGWRTKWIEFEGDDVIPPISAYQEAAQWIAEQF